VAKHKVSDDIIAKPFSAAAVSDDLVPKHKVTDDIVPKIALYRDPMPMLADDIAMPKTANDAKRKSADNAFLRPKISDDITVKPKVNDDTNIM
jgi:hypothetical protein